MITSSFEQTKEQCLLADEQISIRRSMCQQNKRDTIEESPLDTVTKRLQILKDLDFKALHKKPLSISEKSKEALERLK